MIYQPRLTLDLRVAIGTGLVRAGILAVSDFISGENKGWTYYLGAALGYTAAATGIPYAAATMFVVCEALDVALFHSPDGSDVDIYVDGILTATIDTFQETGTSWEQFGGIVLDGLRHQIDIVNSPSTNGAKTSSINWLGIGAIYADGGAQVVEDKTHMATWNLAFPISTLQSPNKPKSFLVQMDSGATLADVQDIASAIATPLDAVTGGLLGLPSITILLDLPGGLKSAALTGTNIRRGLLLPVKTTGQDSSFWIPAVSEVVAPIDGDVATTQTQVDALLDVLLAADIGATGLGLTTRYGETFTTREAAGTVTFRK